MLIIRRYMTLVEILIVMMILALVSSVIGINIMKSVKEQKFRMEVSQMVDTLRLAQDLMLIMGADVSVRVKAMEDGKGAEYWLEVEGGVPKQWETIVTGTRHVLKEIHGIFFRDLQPFPVTAGQLDIRFESGGSMMSKGVLRLSDVDRENVEGAQVMAVCLKGYPHPIVSVLEKEHPIECENKEDDELNNKLTFFTVQEILEDDELVKAADIFKKGKNGEVENEEDEEDEEEDAIPVP